MPCPSKAQQEKQQERNRILNLRFKERNY